MGGRSITIFVRRIKDYQTILFLPRDSFQRIILYYLEIGFLPDCYYGAEQSLISK